MIDNIGGEEYKRKQETLDKANQQMNNPKVRLMYEGALTVAQRECERPIGFKDGKNTYRMYRCKCAICGETSYKLPYTKSLFWAFEHNKATNHLPIEQEGGVFFLEDLYK